MIKFSSEPGSPKTPGQGLNQLASGVKPRIPTTNPLAKRAFRPVVPKLGMKINSRFK